MTDTTVLATGLRFGEGPRWHAGRLWLSDMYDHAVKSVGPGGGGDVRVEVEVPGQPSGIGWMPDGTLLVVSMLDRSLLRLADGVLVQHADLSGVAAWHCNDMVVDAQGNAYVGNFGFDLHRAESTRDFSTAAPASLALVRPDGTVTSAADDLAFPNGTVITPDGRTLIVAESMGRRLTAFTRHDDGTLGDSRVWADLGRRLPDGICLDADGAIWFANAGGPECVRVREGGKVLDVIDTGDHCYACMLGGADGTTLFMLTSASSHPDRTTTERSGRVLVSSAPAPGAGLP
ncbi:MAG: SMP-30/gluconolactonase/LRE family protein [Ilumatobacteraceae bacterium]